MTVTAPSTTDGGRHTCHCIVELIGNCKRVSTAAVEGRGYGSTKCAVFTPKLHFQRAPASIKNDGAFQARSLSRSGRSEAVPGYQDVVGSLNPQHLDPNQHRRNYDGMHAVDTPSVHPLQPRQFVSVIIGEAGIGAQVGHSSAGLHPAENVPPGQMLVLN